MSKRQCATCNRDFDAARSAYCEACRASRKAEQKRATWQRHGSKYRAAGSGGNPPTSKWYSTPEAERHRKHLQITLSDEAQEKVSRLAAAAGGSRSAVIEALIMAAAE